MRLGIGADGLCAERGNSSFERTRSGAGHARGHGNCRLGRRVNGAGIENIEKIVVIYAENRSFDNLYGSFPGANGLSRVTPEGYTQRDRDGSVLKELPPIWGGLTAKGFEPAVTQGQTEHLANAPFAIDDPKGFNLPLSVTTRDLWHRFYENQMQIDGGKNDRFAAYADSGALVMGHYAIMAPNCRSGISQNNTCWRTTSSWARSAAPSSIISR